MGPELSDMSAEELLELSEKLKANKTSPQDEYAGQLREERVRTLLTEIDPENLLESIEYRIKGYKYNRQKNAWEKRNNTEEIPSDLIDKVIAKLSSILSLNTTFSNIQPQDVNNIMGLLIDITISDLVVNGKNYGIDTDFNRKEEIGFIIFNTVYLTLRRSINGTEARRFFGSLRMNETITPNQGSRGTMDKIMDALKIYK